MPRGPRCLADPSGRTACPAHIVAVGGALWSSLLYRDKRSWVAQLPRGTVQGVSGTVTADCRVVVPVHDSYIPVHRDILQVRSPHRAWHAQHSLQG